MNKEIYMCDEGICGKVDLSFVYPDMDLKFLGMCCCSCEKKEKCPDRCIILTHKHLKIEECSDRKLYKDLLTGVLDNKRGLLVDTQNRVSDLEKEISTIEGKLHIKSPLDCKSCGSPEVIYDTTTVLLSCPPKYKGMCLKCDTLNYIDTRVYKDNKKK